MCKVIYNKNFKPDSRQLLCRFGKSLGASRLSKRVCRAWHLTSEVEVLVPGIRRAEG